MSEERGEDRDRIDLWIDSLGRYVEWSDDGEVVCPNCGRWPCRCGVPPKFAAHFDVLLDEARRLRSQERGGEPDGWIVSCGSCIESFVYDVDYEAPTGSCPICGDADATVVPFRALSDVEGELGEPDDLESQIREEEPQPPREKPAPPENITFKEGEQPRRAPHTGEDGGEGRCGYCDYPRSDQESHMELVSLLHQFWYKHDQTWLSVHEWASKVETCLADQPGRERD